jgi:hypothetical protein
MFADWHRELGWKPVEMVQKVAEDVGPAYFNISKLPQEIGLVRGNKNLAPDVQTAMLDSRWTLKGEALKAHGDIEEVRATADNLFVSDLRVATSALQALHAVAPGTEQTAMDGKLTQMDRAMRILEGEYGLRPAVLEKGRLKNDKDVPCLDWSNWALLCRDDMPDDVAYRVTSVLVEERAEFEGRFRHIPVHQSPLTYPIDPRRMPHAVDLPLHPGAERAYREAGLLK